MGRDGRQYDGQKQDMQDTFQVSDCNDVGKVTEIFLPDPINRVKTDITNMES